MEIARARAGLLGGTKMIGVFYNKHCVENPNKEPIQLNINFYRAISEAEALTGGRATNVSFERKSALISGYSDNERLLISEF